LSVASYEGKSLGDQMSKPSPTVSWVVFGDAAVIRRLLHTNRSLVLNYDAMKPLDLRKYAPLLVLIALFSACSGPPENGGSANDNASQQANSNSSAQVAQSPSAPGTPLTVQPMPPPAAPEAASVPAKPAETPKANPVANTHGPKLIAPDKKLDFGKQPQDKTLIRAIAIRNAGKENLKIESVAPS
jgi:hypothetical protein